MQKLKNAEDELVDEEYKNYCVIDDCSKFAAAVYYHYINKELLKNEYMNDKLGYGIDLWETSTEMFAKKNTFTNTLVNTMLFELRELGAQKNASIDRIKELKVGDLLYRQGHVEFYIGNNKTVGWGRIHKDNIIRKSFNYNQNGLFYSTDPLDLNQPYTSIIRFTGGYINE